MQKNRDLKTHNKGGWRERSSRGGGGGGGGGGIEYIFVKLLYRMPHRCTRRDAATMEQKPGEYLFASLKTTLSVR